MDKNTLLKVQEAFDANPDAKVLIATSDGQCFATVNEARFHAQSLQDQKTLPLTKDLVEKFLNPVTQEPSAEDKIKAEVASLKVDDLKARLTAEFSKTEEDLKGLKKEALGELLLSLLFAAHAEKINSEQ